MLQMGSSLVARGFAIQASTAAGALVLGSSRSLLANHSSPFISFIRSADSSSHSKVMCFSSASHVYTCPVYAVGKLIGEVCCTADKSGGDVWVQARSIGANYFGLEESSIALVEVRLDNKEVLGVTESSRVGLPELMSRKAVWCVSSPRTGEFSEALKNFERRLKASEDLSRSAINHALHVKRKVIYPVVKRFMAKLGKAGVRKAAMKPVEEVVEHRKGKIPNWAMTAMNAGQLKGGRHGLAVEGDLLSMFVVDRGSLRDLGNQAAHEFTIEDCRETVMDRHGQGDFDSLCRIFFLAYGQEVDDKL